MALAAVRSAVAAADHVIVVEGPAGPPLANEDECPPTPLEELRSPAAVGERARVEVHEGRWRTDAKKRTRMIELTRPLPKPTWAVWIDGDEVLMNAEYLRDWVHALEWSDDPDEPWMGFPIKLVELDGTVAVCQGKVLRVDLVDGYSVSSSVFRNALGNLEARGNLPFSAREWAQLHRPTMDAGNLVLPPPLPGEPFLLHRSFLRHPARRGLRLHEQEAAEIARVRGRDGDRFRAGGTPDASA